MIVCKFFVWFIIYSFFGWIYETTYCTIRKHHWENRGFLYGPILPIYGVGALLASIVFSMLPVSNLQKASNLLIFVICFFGSIILEYTTHWILEKLFHAYWWDYSKQFCNIHGRVCLFASLGFGVAGIIVIRILLPLVTNMTSSISPIPMEVLALIFMLLFGMDLALTVSALTNFAKNFARIEQEINEQMSLRYDNLETSICEKKDALLEKTERLQEGAYIRKELIEEKASDIKEQLTSEYLERLLKGTSNVQKKALLHIQGFHKDSEHNFALKERMVTLIRERKNRNSN